MPIRRCNRVTVYPVRNDEEVPMCVEIYFGASLGYKISTKETIGRIPLL